MAEKYINPHTDFGFKRLFGSEFNKELLISFLNAMFHGEQNVQGVTYLNSEQLGDRVDARRAIFDVYCENDKGEKFIVEMQNVYQEFFKDRTIYYSTFPIREQSRAKEKDILTEMLNNENITEEQKAKCTESMLTLQERMEKESAAEAMIQSKGFKQAYVRMDNDTVDVVVDAVKLTDQDVAQIEDIVQRKTGMPADKIRISTLQK